MNDEEFTTTSDAVESPSAVDTAGNTPQQYGNQNGTQQYGNPNGTQQYGNPNSTQQYGNPNGTQQYGNQNGAQQYGNPNGTQQYGNPNGTQQQYGYSNGQAYGSYQYQNGNGKGTGIGLGIASMVLGIISLLLFFSCINVVLGIIAIVLGGVQIAKNEKKGMAIAGIVTSIISFVLTVLIWIGIVYSGDLSDATYEYKQFYQNELEDDWDGVSVPIDGFTEL